MNWQLIVGIVVVLALAAAIAWGVATLFSKSEADGAGNAGAAALAGAEYPSYPVYPVDAAWPGWGYGYSDWGYPRWRRRRLRDPRYHHPYSS